MIDRSARAPSQREVQLSWVFGFVLLVRLLFPFFDSPLSHLYSDPLRHWETGRDFLHPTVMGSGDPFMYQLWLYLLQKLAGNSTAAILTGCGVLCAGMPYGWYRALRELMPRRWALGSALLIGVAPGFLSIYAYFMTETLLLTLTGFAFWLTLRADRKRTTGAIALACVLWLAAAFTRVVALPLAVACIGWLWLSQPHKPRNLVVAATLAAVIAIPAGLHGAASLGYFAPLGNLYLNEIYRASDNKDIQIDYNAQQNYIFGSPSYYNPTFYPFSDWTTARDDTVSIAINTRNGRADWVHELARIRAEQHGLRLRDRWENLLYLLFGQQWPDNDHSELIGWLAVTSRWLWLPTVIWVAYAALRRRFHGRRWLVPGCALLSFTLLVFQNEGVMEGRFRKPLEPIFVAALALSMSPRSRREP